MAYYAQPTTNAYASNTSPYSSPPIAGAVYPPGSVAYSTPTTSPTILGQPGAPLSPYGQTTFAGAQQQRVSPGMGYAPLGAQGAGVAGVGAGASMGMGMGMGTGVSAQPYTAPPGQTIQPGSVTYTTTMDAHGRVTYHQFRAEPATHTANGITYTGIQWVPTETTYNLPAGATPAGPEFVASWSGGQIPPEQERALRDWQKDEEKRRKKEEKESTKRVAAWEKESKARERAEDKALRAAREQDARMNQEVRRIQDPRGGQGAVFPGASAFDRDRERERFSDRDRDRLGDRDRDREHGRDRVYFPTGAADLERQFADMSVGNRASAYGAPTMPTHPRSRRASMNMPAPAMSGRAQSDPYDDRDQYGDPADRGLYSNDRLDAVQGPYPVPGTRSRANSTVGMGASPYRQSVGLNGMPVHSSGHMLDGQPMGSLSRSHSPAPMGGYGAVPGGFIPPGGGTVSPRMPTAQLGTGGGGGMKLPSSVPEAFSRPINRAVTFTPFEMTKIQDLAEFSKNPPRMPPVLTTHDVMRDEWGRLINDLILAWTGRLPLPCTPLPPKRTTLTMDLLDLWNAEFFLARGVELVLYRGRERVTGRGVGRPEYRLPRIDDSDSEVTTETTGESDSEDDHGHGGSRLADHYGGYGRDNDQYTELREQRRYRKQQKEEKKRRAKEKKLKRKEKRERVYTLYMTYVPPREFSSAGLPLY